MLRNSEGDIWAMFIKSVGILDSNEGEVLTILEALGIFQMHFHVFHAFLVVETH